MHLCACFNFGLNVTTHWTSFFRQRSLCLKLARRTEAFLMGACNYYSISSSLQMLRRCVPSIAWEGGQKEAKQNVRALSAVLSVKCCWQSAFSVSRLLTVNRADSRWSTNTCSDSLVSFACWHILFGILTPQSPPTTPLSCDDCHPCPPSTSNDCKDTLSPPWPSHLGEITTASLDFSVCFDLALSPPSPLRFWQRG